MQITLTGDEHADLINSRKTALDYAAKLEHELADAKANALALGTANAKALTELARAAFEVVRFAIANLPPETIRGWPHAKLVEIAERLPALPDYAINDHDLAMELRAFAAECERHMHRRNVRAEPPTLT